MSDGEKPFDGMTPATERDHGMPEGWRHARLNDPDTSKAAAKGDRTALKEKIYASVKVLTDTRMGGTKWDVADATGILAESVHKRISDLQDAGRVRDSGWRREGPSGRECIVWVTTG